VLGMASQALLMLAAVNSSPAVYTTFSELSGARCRQGAGGFPSWSRTGSSQELQLLAKAGQSKGTHGHKAV
jgi:hypothetical protein